MKNISLFGVIGIALLAGGCNKQPRQQYTRTVVAQQPAQQVVVAQGDDCDADDRFEYDMDCGYTAFQHSQRMAYLRSIGYKKPAHKKPSLFRGAGHTAPYKYNRPVTTSRPMPATTTRSVSRPSVGYSAPVRSAPSVSYSRPSSSSMSRPMSSSRR